MGVKIELDKKEMDTVIYCLKKSLSKNQYEFLKRLETEDRVDALKYDGFKKNTFDALEKLGYIDITRNRVVQRAKSPYLLIKFFETLNK